MDPCLSLHGLVRASFPRTRGDGPSPGCESEIATALPPHARGWTLFVSSAYTRHVVSPARAGMDPGRCVYIGTTECFPRTRGDGPVTSPNVISRASFPPHARGWTQTVIWEEKFGDVSPARAGMDPACISTVTPAGGFPRTRGDGPDEDEKRWRRVRLPPHARGWTLEEEKPLDIACASPARAGMDLK